MKKLLLVLLSIETLSTFAQKKDSAKTPITSYISAGLSVSNSNAFRASSYAGVEAGLMRDNIALSFAFGRASLVGMGSKADNSQNYYYEFKSYGYFPMGSLTGNVIFGYGGLFDTSHNFIEYGMGMTYSVGKIGYGVTYSNWDTNNYITPSITYNF